MASGHPRRRRLRPWVTGLAVLAALLGSAYVFWLRDSPLVAVERTTVTGLTTAHAPRIRQELVDAASGMTTLNVDVERLERTVADRPVVAALNVDAHLPHGLTIEVVEHRAIAAVPGQGGEPVAVAAGGLLLPDVEVTRSLTELPVEGPVSGARLSGDDALEALAAVEAIEAPLAARVTRIEHIPSAGGLVAMVDGGPEIRLGEADDLERKWAAASAVLGDRQAAQAHYVDVSLPIRPSVGG